MKRLNLCLKILICILLCGCIVMTATGCFGNFLPGKIASEEVLEDSTDPSYEEKLEEVLNIINHYYVDEYDEGALGDYLAQAAVAATGDRWSYYILSLIHISEPTRPY